MLLSSVGIVVTFHTGIQSSKTKNNQSEGKGMQQNKINAKARAMKEKDFGHRRKKERLEETTLRNSNVIVVSCKRVRPLCAVRLSGKIICSSFSIALTNTNAL